MSDGLHASFTRRFPAGPAITVEDLAAPPRSGITVLFGASGSGKTTILRCLAGLERPDAGRVGFDGEPWSDAEAGIFLPPRRRKVGFVPQDYALFPHLSVAGNVGYGLSDLPAAERRSRVAETLRWLGLEDLGRRSPAEISGGQQQRVALARALARQPRLLLLDEPLSALDTPTRHRLRGELRQLLRQLQGPTIFVTHDRLEAMALGDRIVVLEGGRIAQRGPTRDVFNRPANLAVAAMIGIETLQPGQIVGLEHDLATVQVGGTRLIALAEELPSAARDVFVCIRAEDVVLTPDTGAGASARNRLRATVRALAPEGLLMCVELECGFPLKALLTRQACEELKLQPGATVTAMIKAPHIHLIPRSE